MCQSAGPRMPEKPTHQHHALSLFQARSLEQKRTWCYEVKRLMLENYNAIIPDKAKELVMKLGKSKEEEG